jgi:hypothetical protein
MKRTLAASALLLVASRAYGASSVTPSIAVDTRFPAVTTCEVTSNSGLSLVVTIDMYNPNGVRVDRAGPFTLAAHNSRALLPDAPVDGFHCRFIVDGPKAAYIGAAKYQYTVNGRIQEQGYLDR